MLKIIILLLMTFSLSSCRSIQRQIVCSEIRKQEIKPVQLCDISFQFNRCRCRCFDFNSWEKLPLNACGMTPVREADSLDFPLGHCEGVAGFFLEDIAEEIKPRIKAMFRLKENLCQ